MTDPLHKTLDAWERDQEADPRMSARVRHKARMFLDAGMASTDEALRARLERLANQPDNPLAAGLPPLPIPFVELENCPGTQVLNNRVRGMDQMVKARASPGLEISGNDFEARDLALERVRLESLLKLKQAISDAGAALQPAQAKELTRLADELQPSKPAKASTLDKLKEFGAKQIDKGLAVAIAELLKHWLS